LICDGHDIFEGQPHLGGIGDGSVGEEGIINARDSFNFDFFFFYVSGYSDRNSSYDI
jgi:hypothetical protein